VLLSLVVTCHITIALVMPLSRLTEQAAHVRSPQNLVEGGDQFAGAWW